MIVYKYLYFLLLNSEFKFDAFVTGFEFYAAEAGTASIIVKICSNLIYSFLLNSKLILITKKRLPHLIPFAPRRRSLVQILY